MITAKQKERWLQRLRSPTSKKKTRFMLENLTVKRLLLAARMNEKEIVDEAMSNCACAMGHCYLANITAFAEIDGYFDMRQVLGDKAYEAIAEMNDVLDLPLDEIADWIDKNITTAEDHVHSTFG